MSTKRPGNPRPSPKTWTQEVGKRICGARKEKGLERAQLAEQAEIPYSTLRGYEYGTNEPSAGRLARLADVLAVSVDWLVGRVPAGLAATLASVQIRLSSSPSSRGVHGEEEFCAVPVFSEKGILSEGNPGEKEEIREYAIFPASHFYGKSDVVGFRLDRNPPKPIPACIPAPAILFMDRRDKRIAATGIYAIRLDGPALAFGRLHWAPPNLVLYSALSEGKFTSMKLRESEQPVSRILGRVILSLQWHD